MAATENSTLERAHMIEYKRIHFELFVNRRDDLFIVQVNKSMIAVLRSMISDHESQGNSLVLISCSCLTSTHTNSMGHLIFVVVLVPT